MQAFQSTQESIAPVPRNSISFLSKDEINDLEYQKYCKAQARNQKRLEYYHKKEEELQQECQNEQTQLNKRESSTLSSNTKDSSSSNSLFTVQQQQQQQQKEQPQKQPIQQSTDTNTLSSYAFNLTQPSTSLLSTTANASTTTTASKKIDAREVIEETAEELENSEVLFPPPSPLSHLKGKTYSGLHKADTIPKYQRNWTILPTQSPIRTPEPPELRENIPLAFVDAPKTPTAIISCDNTIVHKPVARVSTASLKQKLQTGTADESRGSITSTSSVASSQQGLIEHRQQQPYRTQTPTALPQKKQSVPIIIEDRTGPVTMAFQSLDEHLQQDDSLPSSRCYTPSLSNKPIPVVPFYQTPEKLIFDECPATHAQSYNLRVASPLPDRCRSPASGPPPNPLAAIRAPRIKDTELSSFSPRVLQAGSITTGQSYLGAQQQQQGQILSHFETSAKAATQTFTALPEIVEERKIGDLTVQKREKQSRLDEQQKSQSQSQTTTQVGNAQIERRRRVTEEFEHTQSAKTIEISTGSTSSSTDRRQSYGKTGFVANQARRLSGLEQEISNLTTQSQAISARAANLTETTFPQLKSPEPISKFPIKPVLPSHDESRPSGYLLSPTTYNQLVAPPPGFQKDQQQQQKQQESSITYGTSLGSSQQQQKSLSAYSSATTTTSSLLQSNVVSSNLTKASATSITNQAYSASATQYGSPISNNIKQDCSGICPLTKNFALPGETCCKQQELQSQPSTGAVVAAGNNVSNNIYRPTASTGLTGFKPPQTSTSTSAPPASVALQAPIVPPVVAPTTSIIDNNVNNDSSGAAGKAGGVFTATSTPKRGRGIYNKAVAPGVRVPLCNSCQTQIRGPFITALGRIWCPDHFICVNANCRRALQDIGFVEEKGDLYCEYCFEKYLAPTCSKCAGKIKGDCLNAIGRHFHPECFTCGHCGKIFGNTPFFLEDGNAYCEADWNELFTTKCFACGFPVEAGDRWVEALNHNYHSQCFNCTYCKANLEGQSFYNKGGRPFCKNHAR